jgi:hypothetical protein
MPLWLVEDPSTVYFILGLVALGCAVGFWLRQERKYLTGLGIALVLVGLVALLDFLVVTDFERMKMHVEEMAKSVAKKDTDRICSHISDRFRVGVGDKTTFRRLIDNWMKKGEVTELIVWEFERSDISREKKQGKITFLVKGRGPHLDQRYLRCIATFVLEADGKWRLSTFELVDPLKEPGKGDSVPIPDVVF